MNCWQSSVGSLILYVKAVQTSTLLHRAADTANAIHFLYIVNKLQRRASDLCVHLLFACYGSIIHLPFC